jgi:folate-binding Fe-S cluster repair protein YgfZ
VAHLASRGVISLQGPDAVEFLQVGVREHTCVAQPVQL